MKKNLTLSKLFLAIINLSICTGSFGQNINSNGQQNSQWKTNGNSADTNNFIGTTNSQNIRFKTNNVERLRLTKEGDLGLGTTTPAGKLDVNGTTYIRQDLYLTQLQSPSTLPNEILYIDPVTGLVTRGSIEKALEYAYQIHKKCEPGMPVLNPTWSNGLNKIFSECPDVFVGIGTNAPRVKLDVIGKIYGGSLSIGADPLLNNARFHLKASLSPSSIANMIMVESNLEQLLSLNYQGLITTRNMVVDAKDNATPFIIKNSTRKLLQVDNDGLLHARRIKVDAASWADFVFDDDYELMPLSEVKTFISLNNHLPNVPSESEVKENGIDLLEMNKILLQKVEELTLYLIEQNNQIDSLNKKVEILEKIQN